MRAIGAAAGVSVPTVELVFGTKPRLLKTVIDVAIAGARRPAPTREEDIPVTEREHASSSLGALAHGQLCYLQIPARDITQSAEFYMTIFGWHTDPPNSGFEAPGLIGQWIDERAAAPEAGPLAWINVDHIDAALTQVTAHGGEVVESPSLDGGMRWLATIRDPAGNTVGIVQLGPR